MAGIYIHIPFCKQACHYCDFHFSTSLKYKDEMIDAIKKELRLQKNFLNKQSIQSIYFGGGSPSILNAEELGSIIDEVMQLHSVSANAEITIEANPDDLDRSKVNDLRQLPINRFSIGIQSFFNDDLIWMNRAHNSTEAESCVKRVQDAGFENITIDLIYGYPMLTDAKWKQNMATAIALNVPHISSYALTVEPKTALASFIKSGKQPAVNDEQSAAQFVQLMETLTHAGFDHYEISNFGKPGKHAVHNTNYWKGAHYLGIGPSAHSFTGTTRYWNIANNAKYLDALSKGTVPAEIEELSQSDRFNEYIMTALRTMWGLSLQKITADFGSDHLKATQQAITPFEEKGWLKTLDGMVTLTNAGKLFADHIAAELFITEQ